MQQKGIESLKTEEPVSLWQSAFIKGKSHYSNLVCQAVNSAKHSTDNTSKAISLGGRLVT